MSTTPSNTAPVIVDGSSSTAANRVLNGSQGLNPFAPDFTPASPRVAKGIDAASNATTAVASAGDAQLEPAPAVETLVSFENTTAVTSPVQAIASTAAVPPPAAPYPIINTTTTYNQTTPPPTASRTQHPIPPFDIHLYKPNHTRLRSAPWYSPLCTPRCNTCHENTVGGLTPCHIRLHAPTPPAGAEWNNLFHKNNQTSIYITENGDYMPWWTITSTHNTPISSPPAPPPQSGTEGEKDTAAALADTEAERSARRNARMAVLVHKELVYLRSIAVGNGEYFSLVLKDPEWYPGVKCPIIMELWGGDDDARRGFHRFERFDTGESEREIMEDIMVHRMILRDRKRVGSTELSVKEVEAVEGKLRELRRMLDAEIEWEEKRCDAWWDEEPFYEKRRLMRVRAEDRPVGKAFGVYIYDSEDVKMGSDSVL